MRSVCGNERKKINSKMDALLFLGTILLDCYQRTDGRGCQLGYEAPASRKQVITSGW